MVCNYLLGVSPEDADRSQPVKRRRNLSSLLTLVNVCNNLFWINIQTVTMNFKKKGHLCRPNLRLGKSNCLITVELLCRTGFPTKLEPGEGGQLSSQPTASVSAGRNAELCFSRSTLPAGLLLHCHGKQPPQQHPHRLPWHHRCRDGCLTGLSGHILPIWSVHAQKVINYAFISLGQFIWQVWR